jgi:hypothetical protein
MNPTQTGGELRINILHPVDREFIDSVRRAFFTSRIKEFMLHKHLDFGQAWAKAASICVTPHVPCGRFTKRTLAGSQPKIPSGLVKGTPTILYKLN